MWWAQYTTFLILHVYNKGSKLIKISDNYKCIWTVLFECANALYALVTWYSFPVASYSMSLWKDYNPSAESIMTSTHLLKENKRSCTSFQPFGYTSQSPPSAFCHCRFLEHVLWIILSSLLSVFVFIMKAWGCDQKERALSWSCTL